MFIVREAAYSPGWYGGMYTEVFVFCDAVRHAVDVLPMLSTQHIPVFWLKAVLQGVISPPKPPPNSLGGHR